MALVAVAPHRYFRGFQPGQEWAPTGYVVTELSAALERVYPTNAHLTAYVVEGVERHARINKPGLAHVGRRLLLGTFLCDVDNPGHAAWTDEGFAAARAQDLALPSLRTAGVYYTRHGRRIVQPLVAPLVVDDLVEAHLARWLHQLEAEGLAVDWKCIDWTRHFQLPHVPRQPGGRSRLVDLDHMTPIAIEPLEITSRAPSAEPAVRAPRTSSAPVAWTTTLPDVWHAAIATIASAVAAVPTEWHSLFLALAGTLLRRGLPPEHVPAFCGAVSIATGADDRSEGRIRDARTTVERHRAGLPVTGYATLAGQWPGVASAVDAALARGREQRARELLARPSSDAVTGGPSTLAETTTALEAAIRVAPDGLTLIQAGCGLGKTRAAERVAAERAATTYATKDAAGLRAPLQSKTSISVDKHTLAKQVVRHLRVLGTDATWHFGPLGKTDADGKPICKIADVAQPLVEGGQPMHWVLCRGRDLHPCEHFAACTAKDGFEGPEHARVHVGPHALVSALASEAGRTGLLILDEPPPPLETLSFTSADFVTTIATLDAFDGAYGAALRPALEAVETWLAVGPTQATATTVEGVVATYAHLGDHAVLAQARRSAALPQGDALGCARAAPLPGGGPTAPPIRWEHLAIARGNPVHARKIGATSRVLRAMHGALTSESPVAVRLEDRGARRVMHLTRVREPFVAALRRQGSAVVLDANVDLWAPVYAKVVGYDPPIRRFQAPDGASIERTFFRLGSATRTAWLDDGRLRLAPSLRTAIRTAFAWAEEKPGNGTLAILSIYVVELALRAVLTPEDSSIDEAWTRVGQRAGMLAAVRAELGPILRGWKGSILFGHYGGLRGLDAMADADSLVTLGDPWANIDQVRHECVYLGLEDWEARLEAMCRAELEQAHGRLRTVHRTRPGRALHVGAVVPGGAGWSEGVVTFRQARAGRPTKGDTVSTDDLRDAIAALGGMRAAARALGVAPSTISRAASGDRTLPNEANEAVRRVLDQAAQGVARIPC